MLYAVLRTVLGLLLAVALVFLMLYFIKPVG